MLLLIASIFTMPAAVHSLTHHDDRNLPRWAATDDRKRAMPMSSFVRRTHVARERGREGREIDGFMTGLALIPRRTYQDDVKLPRVTKI